MTPRLATGRIVWAEIADANGIRKVRPAVIVTATDQLTAVGPFDVVAITSRLTDPLPEDHVLLPWHPQRHPRTGLNRRCAAVCTWLAQIVANDILDVAGIVPNSLMATILAKVAAALAPPPPPEGGSGTAPNDASTDPPAAPA
jgi:mRNA-degrading endonuclease toxin of MazEF toxin-antitoxin module